MATEAQYKFFKELYDEENKRYSDLDNKGKLYVTIITFYLGAIAFKFNDVTQLTVQVSYAKWFYLVIVSVLVVALLCTIFAIRVRSFEGIADPVKVIDNYGESAPSDTDFLDDRIADLAVATNRNSNQNNRIAGSLALASVFIFLAGTIQFVLLLIAILKLRG